MKHKAKRIVSAICALALCAAMLPVQAFADTEVPGSSVVEPADSTTGDTTLDTTPGDTTAKQEGDTPAAMTGGTTNEQNSSAPTSGTTPETTTGDTGEGTTPAAGSGNDEQGQTPAGGSQDGTSAGTDAPTLSPFTYDVAPLTAAPQASNTVTVTYNAGKLDGESLENVVKNSEEKGQFDANYIVNTTDPNGNGGDTSKGDFSVTFTVPTESFPCPYTVMYPADRVVKKGETWYVFDGWKVEGAADEEGKTLTFDSGTGTTEVTLTASGNVTLTAQWAENSPDPKEEPRFPGDPITIEVYLDGQPLTNVDFGENNDYIDFSKSENTNTGSEVTSTKVENSSAEKPKYETQYVYTYNKANCADLKFTVKGHYQLVAVDADIVWGAGGGQGIVPDGNGWLVDNIKNGSTVKLYLATPYKVVYYVDGDPLDEGDDDTYYAEADVTANEKEKWYIKGNNVDEKNQVINAWDGTQTSCDAIWKNDSAKTSIQLKETTFTIDGKKTNVIGWYKTATDTTLLTGPLALSAILAADSGYTIDSNNHIIKFFGTSEQPGITVKKEGAAKPDSVNGGMNIDYTITVTNTGNSALTELKLTDTMFAGLNAEEDFTVTASGAALSDKTTRKIDGTTLTITFAEGNSLPVGGTVTFAYTHKVTDNELVDKGDGVKIVMNAVAVTATTVYGSEPDGGAETSTEVYSGTVTMQPANITIYMGGKGGYNGVLEDVDKGTIVSNNKTLPEPGFYFTLPTTISEKLNEAVHRYYPQEGNPADLHYYITIRAKTNNGEQREWTLKKYGADTSAAMIGNQAEFIYKIVPSENQPPIRMQFKDSKGTTVTSDKFTIDDMRSLAAEYTMSLYLNGVDPCTITFEIKIPAGNNGEIAKTYYCGFAQSEGATLTVRYASEKQTTVKAVTDKSNLDTGTFGLVVGSDQTFNINQKDEGADGVDVTHEDVSLLVDSLVGGENNTYTSTLYQKAVAKAGFSSNSVWGQYLDLVDAENGNAWLTTENDEEVTVFWPYPAGVTKDSGNIKLYHFRGLDRDNSTEEAYAEVTSVQPEEVTITRLDDGFTFTTSNFSPFVLVQDTTQPSGGNDGNSGSNDNNNTTTSNQTTTVTATANASAPAAAAPAATAVPQTSDDMPLGALTATAAAAAAAFVALLVVRKRRQSRD